MGCILHWSRGLPQVTDRNAGGCFWGFGDPIWPVPQKIDVPRVLDKDESAPISILGYPLVMIVAEKVVTMIQRGERGRIAIISDSSESIDVLIHHIGRVVPIFTHALPTHFGRMRGSVAWYWPVDLGTAGHPQLRCA